MDGGATKGFVKVKFEQVKIGESFVYKGMRYVKIALSMTQDENRIGTIFHTETEVEPAQKTQAEPGEQNPS